jgi:endonuclease/exonuclease/phosphatase family metal-dependent hydrolase
MKLVSWNMQRGRGRPVGQVMADLRRLADFDILCLQEVSSGYTDLPGLTGEDQFAQVAAQLPGFAAVPHIVSDTLGASASRKLFGNMILSRYPVLQARRHCLPWPLDAAVTSMQRGALEASLQTPLGLITVCTTHLEYFSAIQRAAQVERLRDLQRDNALYAAASHPDGGNGPFRSIARSEQALLAGDFNFTPGSSEYQRLLAPFEQGVASYCDTWALQHPGMPNEPSVGLHDRDGTPFTFDYIFATATLRGQIRDLRVLPEPLGSDHQPLLLELA